MTKISASLLAAHPLCVRESIARMEAAGVDRLHLDIMDGVFVPNISFGPDFVRAVRQETNLFLDVHLMIVRPERYIETFAQAGADGLTVHLEACEEPETVLGEIARLGMAPGLTWKPGTSWEKARAFFPFSQNVLVMTVEPGFGGQPMLQNAADNIPAIRAVLDVQPQGAITLSVDGGVTSKTAGQLAESGADILVAGTALVRAKNPEAFVQAIHAL